MQFENRQLCNLVYRRCSWTPHQQGIQWKQHWRLCSRNIRWRRGCYRHWVGMVLVPLRTLKILKIKDCMSFLKKVYSLTNKSRATRSAIRPKCKRIRCRITSTLDKPCSIFWQLWIEPILVTEVILPVMNMLNTSKARIWRNIQISRKLVEINLIPNGIRAW